MILKATSRETAQVIYTDKGANGILRFKAWYESVNGRFETISTVGNKYYGKSYYASVSHFLHIAVEKKLDSNDNENIPKFDKGRWFQCETIPNDETYNRKTYTDFFVLGTPNTTWERLENTYNKTASYTILGTPNEEISFELDKEMILELTRDYQPSTGSYLYPAWDGNLTLDYYIWSGVDTIPTHKTYTLPLTIESIYCDTDFDERPNRPVYDNKPYYEIHSESSVIYINDTPERIVTNKEEFLVLNPILTLELNKAGSLTFDLPYTNNAYNSLKKLKSTITVSQGSEILFEGRVLNDSRNFNNTKSVYCEGALAWLQDVFTIPYTLRGRAKYLFRQLLDRYNDLCSSNREIDFVFSDATTKLLVNQNERSDILSEIQSIRAKTGTNIMMYYSGGTRGIMMFNEYANICDQEIIFGENLLDFSEYIDASNVFTRLHAIGGTLPDGDTLKLIDDSYLYDTWINNDTGYELFGSIYKVVKFDTTDYTILRKNAESYLAKNIYMNSTISISAVDLHLLNVNYDKIRLGDRVRIISAPHGVDDYFVCSKIVLNLADPSKSVYTFGSSESTLTEKIVDLNKDYSYIKEV